MRWTVSINLFFFLKTGNADGRQQGGSQLSPAVIEVFSMPVWPPIHFAAGIVHSVLALGTLGRSDPQQLPNGTLPGWRHRLSTSYNPAAQLNQGDLYPFNFFQHLWANLLVDRTCEHWWKEKVLLYFKQGIIREEEYINKTSCIKSGRLRLSICICLRLAEDSTPHAEERCWLRGEDRVPRLAPGAVWQARDVMDWCFKTCIIGKWEWFISLPCFCVMPSVCIPEWTGMSYFACL